jgi:hypothetical protein
MFNCVFIVLQHVMYCLKAIMTITTWRGVHVRTYPQVMCSCVDLPPIALFLFGLNLSGGKPALNTYSEMVHVSVVPIYRHIVLRRPICRHKNV